MTTRDTAITERKLVITRILSAPRELVFKMWTDPRQRNRPKTKQGV